MSWWKRILPIASIAACLAMPAAAQGWGVGATYGWFNDLEHNFRLDNFHSPNWEGWVEAHLASNTLLRLTYGDMKVRGDNVGQPVFVLGAPVTIPEYRDRIRYVLVGASYLFPEGPLTSALSAGLGGYSIQPDSISPTLNPFRDDRERVFGLHVGGEADVQIYRGLDAVGKLTYHYIFTQTKRSLLVASVGARYRF